MSILFLFVDGIGIGNSDESNPFHYLSLPAFEKLALNNKLNSSFQTNQTQKQFVTSLDARLGVEGLPQSGTGQVTLFTGENASALIGKHFGPYPHSETKPILETKSVFKQLQQLDKKPYFMNAFPPIFFELAEKRNRWSTCTLMSKYSGLPINSIDEILQEKAVTAEITQEIWKSRLGIDIPSITEFDAAKRVHHQLRENDLVLVEYYLTDKAGHEKNPEMAEQVLRRYDVFLQSVIADLSENDTLVLTSDHGNLEDLSLKTHTFNQVPLLVYGKHASAFSKCTSLMDVTPAIISCI